MIMPEEKLLLKDGTVCVLRSAEPEDAQRVIAYMTIMLGETPYLVRTPEEFDYTAEEEAVLLRRRLDDPRGLMLSLIHI